MGKLSEVVKGMNDGLDPKIEEQSIKNARYVWQDIVLVLKAMYKVDHIDDLEVVMADKDFTLNDAEDALIAHKYAILEKSQEKKSRGRRL